MYLNGFWLCMTQYYWQCNNEHILTLCWKFSCCSGFFSKQLVFEVLQKQYPCLCILFSCFLPKPKQCYLNLDHVLRDFQHAPICAVSLWFPILWFSFNWCCPSLWSGFASCWEFSIWDAAWGLGISWMEVISSCAQQHSCSVAVNSEVFAWWVYAVINIFQTGKFETEPVRSRFFLAHQGS